MTKSITMLPGASANGDVGQGLLTGGNTYSCSDGVADELVNRGKAFYVYPAPPTPTVSFNAPRSAAQLAGVPPAADVALSATTQFYDPAQVVDATHPYVYYTATLAAYVRIGGASAPVSVSPTLVPYSSTIPLDGNKYSGDHTLTSNEVLTPGATVEGGSYYVDINPAGFTPDVSAFKVRGDAFNSAHIMQATFGFQRVAQLIWSDLGVAPVAPTITTQPANASVTAPATATFTVVASGTAPLAYQWSKSLDGGTTWTSISGATAASYTTPATTIGSSKFECVVTNSAGSVTSSAATLTAAAAPVARTDTFTRANNAASLGTPSDGGSAWVASGLVAGISSNHGYFVGAAPANTRGLAYLELGTPNTAAQATINLADQNFIHFAGLAFGIVDPNNYYQAVIGYGGSFSINAVVAGVSNVIQAASNPIPSYSPTGTYTIAIQRNNTTGVMSASVNGSVLVNATDTTFSTGTKAGITVISDAGDPGGATSNTLFSAFSAS